MTTTDSPLGQAIALLWQDCPEDVYTDPTTWPRWAKLLPHVMAATERVGPQEHEDLATQTSWLLDSAGAYEQVRGRYGEARPLLERALVIDEAALGPDHPVTRIIRGNLASLE